MRYLYHLKWIKYYRELSKSNKNAWVYAWLFMRDHCQRSFMED